MFDDVSQNGVDLTFLRGRHGQRGIFNKPCEGAGSPRVTLETSDVHFKKVPVEMFFFLVGLNAGGITSVLHLGRKQEVMAAIFPWETTGEGQEEDCGIITNGCF